MANPRGHAEENRNFPALTGGERDLEQIVGVLRIGGFEHRCDSGLSVAAAVLFVLRRGQAGVVGNDENITTVYARISHREQHIGGDVEADVFHRAEHAGLGERGAEGDFSRDFFVGCPLSFSAEGAEAFENFGRRRAGIAGAEGDAAVQRGEGNSFVAA